MHSFTVSVQCNHLQGDKRGEGSERLNEQLPVLMLICCENSVFAVIFFFPTTTRSSARTVSAGVRFPSAARPLHVRGRASACVCACADSCVDVYQRVGVGERPRWKGERSGEGGC